MVNQDIYNKLTKPFCNRIQLAIIFLAIIGHPVSAQDTTRPPRTIHSLQEYLNTVADDPGKKMIELKKAIPGLIYDLRYSTSNNFMLRQMYIPPATFSFLRVPAAQALAKVQEELANAGLGLKVFDAYRPYSVTVKFWELVKDERYVANPVKGSGHNRGIAVDLTLIRLSNMQELNMGTGFDNFSDTAHHSFKGLPESVLQNRSLLRYTMEKYGFKSLETEWWHYFLPEASRFELLDLSFEELRKTY